MGKLLPIIMLLIGTGAGIGAGLVLTPKETEHASDVSEHGAEHPEEPHDQTPKAKDEAHPAPKAKAAHGGAHDDGHGADASELDYVKLNNQFVVPVVGGDRVEALVVLSLSIEADPNLREAIYAREPKVRDAFLQVLFDHSNMGGFQGAFTRANNLDVLRTALTEVAQHEFGSGVYGVLIIDIARQDV